MARIYRGWMLAAGTVAIVSAQVAAASSLPNRTPAVDPLLSVSVLGTPQSRAAVCSPNETGNRCVLSGSAPLTLSAATIAAAQTESSTPPPKSITWPLIIGLIAIVVAAVLVFSNNGDGEGDLTPISPA